MELEITKGNQPDGWRSHATLYMFYVESPRIYTKWFLGGSEPPAVAGNKLGGGFLSAGVPAEKIVLGVRSSYPPGLRPAPPRGS